MKSVPHTTALLLLIAVAVSDAAPSRPCDGKRRDEKQVEARVVELVRLLNGDTPQDDQTAAEMFSQNATMMIPRESVYVGKQAIAARLPQVRPITQFTIHAIQQLCPARWVMTRGEADFVIPGGILKQNIVIEWEKVKRTWKIALLMLSIAA